MSKERRTTPGESGRALVVAPTPYYVEKGSSLRVHAMVERLRSRGFDVDVVCYAGGSDPDLDGVRVIRAGIPGLVDTDAGPSLADAVNDVFVTLEALWAVLTRGYDVVQGEDVEGFAIAVLVSPFHDGDLVYDLHNPLTETLRINDVPVPAALSRAVEGFLYRRADQILANWGVWAEAIEARHDRAAVEVVYDDLPTETREVDLPTDRYLVYVGNFRPYQAVDLLLEAFEAVADETDVDLVLVGEPTAEISRAVAASSAGERVHLLGRQDVPAANAIIAGAVASVVPRRSGEQPGTKLLHYAMHEPPIIATDLPCNRELERFDNRVYWAAPTAESLAERIREACDVA